MLKRRLKQTWKEGNIDSASRSPASDLAASSRDGSVEASTITNPLEAESAPPMNIGVKRSRPDSDNENAAPERPVKLLKTEQSQSLRHHLPEIIDIRDQEESFSSVPIITLKDQVLEQAKNQNLIVVVPHIKASAVLIYQLLRWVAQEKSRLSHSSSGDRPSIVIVDDPLLSDTYCTFLEAESPPLNIKRYTEDIHHPEPDVWAELLNHDVLMTSSWLLLDSLQKGALTISQIHRLVLTDAQSIKNQDSHPSLPIVQLMNDFYRVTYGQPRPRVFALAVLGRNKRSHFDSKTLNLEAAIQCKVFGVKEEKRAEVLALPDRPNETVILYDTPVPPEDTRLLRQLHQLDPSEAIFRRYFRGSRNANEELGACASDLVWRRALKDIEAGLLPWYDYDEDDQEVSKTDRIKSQTRNVVKNWQFTMPNLDPSSRGFNVSHKFLRLIQVLLPFETYGEGFRGIIFVQRRVIALVLVDLLRTLDDRLGFLRPHAVVGSSTQKSYQDIFHNFTTGVCNLLVGTKSLEDLDVPKASVVIRYDLFESQVSHAFVRARTRGRESHLIHFVERGNDIHRRILSRITNLDTDMIRWTEILCHDGVISVPPGSLRETINPYHSDSEGEEENMSDGYLKDPTTSGRIYLQDATTVMYRYAASLREVGLEASDSQPLFEYRDINKEFGLHPMHVCAIKLNGTPVDNISGEASPSKAQARRSACFKGCEALLKAGYLDCRLVPLPSSLRPLHDVDYKHPAFVGDTSEVKSGTRKYLRKNPDFWTNSSENASSILYPTVIMVHGNVDGMSRYSPLAVLTRQPLPSIMSFKLFLSGASVQPTFHKAQAMSLDETRLRHLYRYTVRICRAITNKPLVCSFDEMPYFFMPLHSDWKPSGSSGFLLEDISHHVPWHLVEIAAANWAVPIKRDAPEDIEEELQDAIIQDRAIEFTRRYRVIQVRKDLTPLSKPADSLREAEFDNLYEFCKFKRRNLETLEDFEQPIAEVVKMTAVMNHLTPTCKPPSNPNKTPVKYLIPELCTKFTIPASTLHTAMLLPSVMKRIDDLLLVKELNAKFFDHVIREDLLHVAICTPAAGMEYDYERLELLGDAFLKYLSSIYVFVTNPSLNEGSLHVARQKLISNRTLLHHAVRVGLPVYIQAKVFPFKSWLPQKFRVFVPQTPKAAQAEIKEQSPASEKDKNAEREDQGMAAPEEEEDNKNAEDNDQGMTAPGEEAGAKEQVDEQVENTEMVLEDEGPRQPDPVELEPGELIEDESPDAITPYVVDPPVTTEPTELPKPKKADTKGGGSKKKPKKKKPQGEEHNIQWLGDKAVADVTEAIIGAAYISGGREAALQVTKALSIPISNIDRWSDFGRKVLTPPPNNTARLRPGAVVAVERIIGHKFVRPHLLAQAMTHSSIQGYECTSYERLEFIGDAILDFMVIRYIFDRDQQLTPGALTMLKGSMVSNSTLAAVCVWSGLHEHFLYESTPLQNSIEAYAHELQIQQEKEYELARREGRSAGQYWLAIEPPKPLSDVLESIIGAVYISDNFSSIGAESLFDNILKPFYDKHITLQTLAHHPTKILFELFQAQGCQQFTINKEKELTAFRCSVLVHDVILASAEDAMPGVAARQASYFALDALEGDANFMSRTCDCRTNTSKKPGKKATFEALEEVLARDDDAERDEVDQDAQGNTDA